MRLDLSFGCVPLRERQTSGLRVLRKRSHGTDLVLFPDRVIYGNRGFRLHGRGGEGWRGVGEGSGPPGDNQITLTLKEESLESK